MSNHKESLSLRDKLCRIDGMAPAIQSAASSMMKHYDRSAVVAVNEWRNAVIQSCQNNPDQLLPLLYVANEVLQNSKRNRGNNFLEAFAPVLIQSLQYMAKTIPNAIEKIRRTVKIWGDRHVFSIRYVNEILTVLEPYRHGHVPEDEIPPPPHHEDEEDGAQFSPPRVRKAGTSSSPAGAEMNKSPTHQAANTPGIKSENENASAAADEIMDILEAHDRHPMDDDDDDDLFGSQRSGGGSSTAGPKLEIDVNVETALKRQTSSPYVSPHSTNNKAKRRRSSLSQNSGGGGGNTSASRRASSLKVVLSNTNMLEVWNALSENQQKFELALHTIQRIEDHISGGGGGEDGKDNDGSDLVGDELQQAVLQNQKDIVTMDTQRRLLHQLANERKRLEQEALRYVPWLETSLTQDEQDLEFCDVLHAKVVQFQPVHGILVQTRKVLKQEAERERQRKFKQQQAQKEAEENERFRRAALAKETEAKPGMVWNPTTREYQALNTDESWRD